MNFLDMGFMEILLILLVALLIWGPGKIPEIARNLGKTWNNLKKTSFDLTTQLRKELEEADKENEPSQKKGDDDKPVKKSGTDERETGDTENA